MRYCLLLIVTIFYICTTAMAQEKELQQLLEQNDFFVLRDRLATTRNINDTTRLYYTAFVDNAFNRNALAIRRADSFLLMAGYTWHPQQVLRLEEMMMDSYVKTYRYADAADLAGIIVNKYEPSARGGMINAQKIWTALRHIPPQTASIADNTAVPLTKNKVGLWEIPVQFGNSKVDFLFDTGANISTISQSFADKLGLRQAEVDIAVNSGQGKTVRSKIGVADSLAIGTAVLHHVVFLIMADEELRFKRGDFAINGVIGFPVINALREIHITKDSLTIAAQPADRQLNNLALSGLMPLLRARVNTDTVIFQFDTGAAYTDMYCNYYEKHKDEIPGNRKPVKKKFVSAGGSRNIKVYESGRLRIYIDREMATLYDVNMHTEPVHHAGTGIAEGNMGQDVIKQFREMIINFESMYLRFN